MLELLPFDCLLNDMARNRDNGVDVVEMLAEGCSDASRFMKVMRELCKIYDPLATNL